MTDCLWAQLGQEDKESATVIVLDGLCLFVEVRNFVFLLSTQILAPEATQSTKSTITTTMAEQHTSTTLPTTKRQATNRAAGMKVMTAMTIMQAGLLEGWSKSKQRLALDNKRCSELA